MNKIILKLENNGIFSDKKIRAFSMPQKKLQLLKNQEKSGKKLTYYKWQWYNIYAKNHIHKCLIIFMKGGF